MQVLENVSLDADFGTLEMGAAEMPGIELVRVHVQLQECLTWHPVQLDYGPDYFGSQHATANLLETR